MNYFCIGNNYSLRIHVFDVLNMHWESLCEQLYTIQEHTYLQLSIWMAILHNFNIFNFKWNSASWFYMSNTKHWVYLTSIKPFLLIPSWNNGKIRLCILPFMWKYISLEHPTWLKLFYHPYSFPQANFHLEY